MSRFTLISDAGRKGLLHRAQDSLLEWKLRRSHAEFKGDRRMADAAAKQCDFWADQIQRLVALEGAPE